jgi:hypothetical protein
MVSTSSISQHQSSPDSRTAEIKRLFHSYCSKDSQSSQILSNSACPKNFAILRSTGFLGPYIVASLLRTHTSATVYYLNRNSTGRLRTEEASLKILHGIPIDYSQLRFYVANLTQPAFGLESAQLSILAGQTDKVIFNAWNPHWGKELKYFKLLYKECVLQLSSARQLRGVYA